MSGQSPLKLMASLVLGAGTVALVASGLTSITTNAAAPRAEPGSIAIPEAPATAPTPPFGSEAYTRPMFHRDREPGPDRAPPADVADPAAPTPPDGSPAPAGDLSAFTLKGVIIGERNARAALLAPGAAEPVWVARGDTLEGWTIEAITANGVRIRNGDDAAEIKFLKDE